MTKERLCSNCIDPNRLYEAARGSRFAPQELAPAASRLGKGRGELIGAVVSLASYCNITPEEAAKDLLTTRGLSHQVCDVCGGSGIHPG